MEEERLLKQDTSRYTTFDGLRDAMLLILRGEFRDKHRKWFKDVDPELSSDVDVRVKFAMAPYIDGLHKMALKIKEETRAAMNEILLVIQLFDWPCHNIHFTGNEKCIKPGWYQSSGEVTFAYARWIRY